MICKNYLYSYRSVLFLFFNWFWCSSLKSLLFAISNTLFYTHEYSKTKQISPFKYLGKCWREAKICHKNSSNTIEHPTISVMNRYRSTVGVARTGPRMRDLSLITIGKTYLLNVQVMKRRNHGRFLSPIFVRSSSRRLIPLKRHLFFRVRLKRPRTIPTAEIVSLFSFLNHELYPNYHLVDGRQKNPRGENNPP